MAESSHETNDFLVDGDPKFLRSTTRLLKSDDFLVLAFSSGEELFCELQTRRSRESNCGLWPIAKFKC
jgi:FixJ family two-component response regulator